ncbi:MAG: TIGR02584 family CRISPR-associated protein [Acidobacteria bacterium]|nr:TIGR02584 family CRISPR-associated protein [Acidobacteriota bacterium]
MKTRPNKRVAKAHEIGKTARPHDFPRRVLLAVTGLSPQVVTETLYALTQRVKPAFVPTEIHLLTTAEGAERARLTLLSDDPGWFHRLRRDYRLPEMKFSDRTIHALRTADGDLIGDIRTSVENERLADSLTEAVRELTADPECALHVSIAGGRKTMGFYAGYALSFFGRPQDRLSHVLVSAPYESNQQFYYPTPCRYVIYTNPPQSRPLDARDAEVSLAEIPFVRLRGGLDGRLLEGSVTFSEVVAAAQRALEPQLLEIDFDRKCVFAAGQRVSLAPAQLAFVSWLARRAVEGRPDVSCPSDGAPECEYGDEYMREYRHLGDDLDSLTAKKMQAGMSKTFFEQTKSRLHRALKSALGPEGVRRYGVINTERPPRQYRIAAPTESIRWLGWEFAADGKLAENQPQTRHSL